MAPRRYRRLGTSASTPLRSAARDRPARDSGQRVAAGELLIACDLTLTLAAGLAGEPGVLAPEGIVRRVDVRASGWAIPHGGGAAGCAGSADAARSRTRKPSACLRAACTLPAARIPAPLRPFRRVISRRAGAARTPQQVGYVSLVHGGERMRRARGPRRGRGAASLESVSSPRRRPPRRGKRRETGRDHRASGAHPA